MDAWSFGRPFGSLFPPTHTPRLPDCVSIFDPRPRKEKKKTAGDAHERERERKRRKEAAIGQTREVACDPAPPLGWWALLCCLLPVLLPCCPFRLLPRFSVAWLAAPAAALERDWTDYSLLYKWVGGRVVMVSRPRPVLAFSSFSIASRPNYQKGLIFKKKLAAAVGKEGLVGGQSTCTSTKPQAPNPPNSPPPPSSFNQHTPRPPHQAHPINYPPSASSGLAPRRGGDGRQGLGQIIGLQVAEVRHDSRPHHVGQVDHQHAQAQGEAPVGWLVDWLVG